MNKMYKSLFVVFVLFLHYNWIDCKGKKKDPHRFMFKDSPSNTSNEDEGGEIIPRSRCRHNYNDRTEHAINRQINLYEHASLVYSSMASHFGKCDVSLPGFNKFFKSLATAQREKSETLMSYQTLRGGDVIMYKVQAPPTADWGTGLQAMSHALEMEKSINQALLDLYKISSKLDDSHAANYIMTTYLTPQVESIFKMSTYISSLERVGPGLGEFLFDKLPHN